MCVCVRYLCDLVVRLLCFCLAILIWVGMELLTFLWVWVLRVIDIFLSGSWLVG